MSDVTFDMASNSMEVHKQKAEPWKVTLVDTGEATATGGRLKRIAKYLEPNEPFCFTYGDGLADIDITTEIAFHNNQGKLATVCAVMPPGRYGALQRGGNLVHGFQEKPPGDGSWINGGFFVLQPDVLNYIDGDASSWEGGSLVKIAAEGQLAAFEHSGFWRPMDTLRDKTYLEELWDNHKAPWKVW